MECSDVPPVASPVFASLILAERIKILHVLHSFSAGGLENGIVNIINGSPDHLVHELCFLSTAGEFLQRLRRPVPYHELQKRPGNDLRAILRLRALLRRREIDIVHTRNWGGLDGVMAACMTHKPVVIHGEHGREIDDPAGLNPKRRLVRRALALRARKVVAVSQDLCRWLRVDVGVRPAKLVCIPNGVDTERFRPGRDTAIRQELGVGDEEFVAGFVGRLDPIKNLEGFITSVRLLNRDGLKVRLVIAGNGPERARLENSFKAVSLDPRPLLIGQRPDADRLYRMFDVFVLNSIAEGMSNALLEAMASGLPVICTAVGGNIELVEHNFSGLLIPPNDPAALAGAIRHCAGSRELRERYGAHAREAADNRFSLDGMIQRYASLYESVA
jgi:sugar transferase (PEP-CTERM/EpsH1 system associated)